MERREEREREREREREVGEIESTWNKMARLAPEGGEVEVVTEKKKRTQS